MTSIDVEVQVTTEPQLDVDVQIAPPTFTIMSILPTGPRGPVGPTGATGPAGSSGGSGSYVHDQVAASVTWIVIHNLGMFPNVTTVDTAGTVINGGVQYDSDDQLTITFTTAQSGNAYVS